MNPISRFHFTSASRALCSLPPRSPHAQGSLPSVSLQGESSTTSQHCIASHPGSEWPQCQDWPMSPRTHTVLPAQCVRAQQCETPGTQEWELENLASNRCQRSTRAQARFATQHTATWSSGWRRRSLCFLQAARTPLRKRSEKYECLGPLKQISNVYVRYIMNAHCVCSLSRTHSAIIISQVKTHQTMPIQGNSSSTVDC